MKEINKLNNPSEMFYYKDDGKYKFNEIIGFQFRNALKFIRNNNLFCIIDVNKFNVLINMIESKNI